MKFWWLYPVVGAICLVLSVWAWVGVIAETFSWTFTFPSVITGLFILAGVALLGHAEAVAILTA